MRGRWILLVVIAVSCKKGPAEKPSGPTEKTDKTDKPVPATAATPIFQSQPIQPMCGEKPLALPAPATAPARPDRPLARLDPASCSTTDCTCLAKAVGLTGKASCSPAGEHLVSVTSDPGSEHLAGGSAFVFTGKASFVIESAPEVDLSVTPQASHSAKLDRLERHGELFWIETHHEAQDKDTGEQDRDGEAHGTLCGPTWCARMLLGAWQYAMSLSGPDCTPTKVSTYTVTVDDHSVNVRLEHGADDAGAAGKYTF